MDSEFSFPIEFLTVDEADAAAAEQGIETVRVLESVNGVTKAPMTMDWSSTRLSLIVEDGVVVSAVFV